jgi:phosphate-selective porin OprO/OprP
MKVRSVLAGFVVAGLALAGSVGTVRGEEGAAPSVRVQEGTPGGAGGKGFEEKLDALEKRQQEIERVLKGGGEGGSRGGNGGAAYGLKLKLGGYLQGDGRYHFDEGSGAAAPADSLLVRAAVLTFDGTIGKIAAFRIQPDFGDGKAALLDGWVEILPVPELKVRVGKGKVPVGLERLQSSTELRFVETGLPTALTPNREPGAQLIGELAGGRIMAAAGVFNGVPDGASGDSESDRNKDFAGRIFATPFKGSKIAALEGLGFGLGGSYGRQSGSVDTAKKAIAQNLATYKSPGQQAIFGYRADTTAYSADNTTIADGVRSRIAPQASWYYGPVALLGEYVVSRQEVRRGSLSTDALTHTAWQGSVSWVLTGEKSSSKRVVPARPFDPSSGGWGALELAGRIGALRFDKDSFPAYADPKKSVERAGNVGGAVNWYLNENVKVVADYEQTSFDGGAATGDRRTEKVLFSRFQVAY